MKIISYLFSSKKNVLAILAILLLLVVQAYCDLSLPAYTSDIVDVGIMQGGIPDAVPTQIRESSFDDLSLFMDEKDIDTVNKYYKASTASGEKVLKLDTDDEEVLTELNKIFGAPMMLVALGNGMENIATGDAESGSDNPLAGDQQLNINQIKAGYAAGAVTKDQLIEIKKEAEVQAEALGGMVIDQAAVVYVKAEYEALDFDLEDVQLDYMKKTGFTMVLFTLGSVASAIIVGLLASLTAAGVSRKLRERIYNKTLDFSGDEMDKFTAASLITRNTNDIQQIQMAMVMILRMVLYAPILGIGGVIKVLGTDTGMGWIVLAAVAVLLVVVIGLMGLTMPKFKLLQSLIDKINLVSREILTGIPVIRAFGREKYEEERFDKANKSLVKTQLFTSRAMSLMMPLMMFVMNLISITIVWFGAKGIDVGDLQVGDMMAFITYTMQIVMSFMMLSMISIMLPRANVAANRVAEVLKTKLSIVDKPDTAAVDSRDWIGDVSFNDVSFRYSDAEEDVLSDITFTAKSGETTAIIGSTGSGKSTLINLIPRMFDVTGGSITIDGVDIRDMSQYKLRSLIGAVPQKGVLFNGDIASNVKFGNESITDSDVENAAKIAQATEFIEQKDERYHSPISQGGTNVSGGQKQRLSIARAIAKKPKIFIFDDSFSALDYQTDSKLRKALNDNVQDATIIIVAQRISTILRADRIIVLDEGKVNAIGTHKELLENSEVYREIARSQLSESELSA